MTDALSQEQIAELRELRRRSQLQFTKYDNCLHDAYPALVAAAEREQKLREALARIVDGELLIIDPPMALDIARAALAQETADVLSLTKRSRRRSRRP